MRLVDVDALMKSFENVLGAAPCELNGYEIWEVLNTQEHIDAIPVKWLFDKLEEILSTGVLTGKPDDDLNIRSITQVLMLWGVKMEVKG